MKPFFLLAKKEIKDIFYARTALFFLLLVSFIIGYGFLTAVELYSEQSLAAVGNLLYARGFEPVPGVFGPVYGGLFVLFSLFLPLVIIPILSREREHNTLALLAQLPFSLKEIFLSKITAAFLFLLFVLGLTLPCLLLWRIYGGHIPYYEIAVLISGYLLYGMFVVAVSLLSAAIFESTANAAIFSIFLIISSWVIDFGVSMNAAPYLGVISNWTVTRVLKYFENGILSFSAVMYFILLCAFFSVLSYIMLRFDRAGRWRSISLTVIIFLISLLVVSHLVFNVDMTESRRNSFSSIISTALEQVPDLEIDVYLNREDSRFKDYQNSFLRRLELVRDDVKVRMMTGNDLKRDYGLFAYTVRGKREETYSNSEEEIFPIIFDLAGIDMDSDHTGPEYPGYPLVVTKNLSVIRYIYFLVIPLILICLSMINNYKFRLIRRPAK